MSYQLEYKFKWSKALNCIVATVIKRHEDKSIGTYNAWLWHDGTWIKKRPAKPPYQKTAHKYDLADSWYGGQKKLDEEYAAWVAKHVLK